ncbi:hypothetical protein BJ944DRAFT_267005 [Cunninghamella echinulata]|nr:hypothetical protein BJ944DRAFT_267005 [Cunninghamella echinulata]
MCGRFCLCTVNLETKLKEIGIGVDNQWIDKDKHKPRYNCAPRSYIPVIRKSDKENSATLQSMMWGFVPYFAQKMPDTQPINARDDTLIGGSPVFDKSKNQRRCIVVADGFYEWKKLSNGKKIPYYTKRKDGQLMLFAGIYDEAQPNDWKGSATLCTTAIITTSASSFFSFLHDRMPVILEVDQVEHWLNKSSSWSTDLTKLMKPFEGQLDCYQVTDKVGSTSNESPDFIVPVDSLKSSISNFFTKSSSPTQLPKTALPDKPKSPSPSTISPFPSPKKESKTFFSTTGTKRSNDEKTNSDSQKLKRVKQEPATNNIKQFFHAKSK